MDFEQVKGMQRVIWAKGDYSLLSGWLRPASVALADACAVSAGQEVLDAGAGDGNFAIECAREGAAVVASDISPGMVERGRARSQAEGFDIEWVEGDVEALPFEDARFDCVGRRSARSSRPGRRWRPPSCSGSCGPAAPSA